MSNTASSDKSTSHVQLFNFTKPPILLIGSGISKRYLQNFKSWQELLSSVAERLSIPQRRFQAILTSAKNNPGDFGQYPHLATKLGEILSDGLMNGQYRAEDIFTKNKELELYDQEVDYIKILIASETNQYSLSDTEQVSSELSELRKLSSVIPSVITTNYDCFLEKEVFTNFAIYSSISDYYFSDSQGIGEIYKIHGSVDNPNSLVISENDYKFLKENSKIITAKILSLLCDYPMVILGHSLNDPDITEMIHDLMTSLDVDGLKKISSNIVYISYDEECEEPLIGEKTFEYHNQKLTLSSISIKDFKVIYKEIGKYTPSTTPSNIRKIRQLVKRVVLTTEPTNTQFIKLGIDDLDAEDSRNISLIVVDKATGEIVKDYNILTAKMIINDVINNNASFDERTVLKVFNSYPYYNKDMYLPLYPYIRRCTEDDILQSKKIQEFLQRKKDQFSKKISSTCNMCSKNHYVLSDPFKDVKTYMKPLVVTYLVHTKSITIIQATNMLKMLYNDFEVGNISFDTNFKFAVTYISSLNEKKKV